MTLPSVNFGVSDVLSAMRSYLLGILPQPVEVVRGQANRTPEPSTPNFVVMTPLMQKRLEYNTDVFTDCSFIGSVSTGGILSISQMLIGTVTLGNTLLGSQIPPNIFINSQISGSIGGTGVYQLSGTLGAVSGTKMACGVVMMLNALEFTIQLDVHGPNSSDFTHIIETTFFDQYAVTVFGTAGTAPAGWGPIPYGGTLPVKFIAMSPLYTSEPRQAPFINAEQQYEDRWTIDVVVQTNQAVTVSQQFADTLDVNLLEADVFPFAED